MNDRSGGFTRSKNAADLAGTTALVATDLDADADADLVIAHAAGIDLLAGSLAGTQGTATLASAAALGAETSNALALGDIDGDGDLDKVVANLGINQVFLNDGEGGFAFSGQPGHILGSGDSRAVVLGDLDGDGDLDAVIGNTSAANGASNEIYANDGTGRFQLTQTFAPTSKTLSLVLTYFDTDRRLDIVVGNDGENQVFQNESTNGVIAFVEQPEARPGDDRADRLRSRHRR
jgi:hypothetical protein